MEIPLMVKAAVPVFLIVTDCAVAEAPSAVLANVSDVGVKLTAGAGASPVPVRLTVCGEPDALSVNVSVATRLAAEAGVHVTLPTQASVAPRLAGQLLVCVNEPALAPVMETEVIVRAVLPEFVSWIAATADEVPTKVLGKA